METPSSLMPPIVNVADMRAAARRRLPRMVFDYIDGGAEDEVSYRRNRTQFDEVAFRHRVFVDVSEIDTSVEIFGHRYAAPFGLSPTGLASLAWPNAEVILADVAARQNLPYCLSTVSSVRLEDVAGANAHPKWFQLYVFRDRDLSRELARRAWDAGYRVLVITADCATGGNRERDPRNHFTLPLRLTARTLLDFLTHPHWLMQMALNGAPKPANMVEAASEASASKTAQGLVAFMSSQLDPGVSWRDVEPLVQAWDGPVVIKGVLSTRDAVLAAETGADGLIVSNHGGRQLDGAVSPLSVLPEIAAAVGRDLDVFCDSGFRRGSDIVKALALGAKAVLMGRNTLYGVGAAGARGASHVIDILKADIIRTMTLLGASSLAQIDDEKVIRLAPCPPSPSQTYPPSAYAEAK